MTTKTGVIRPLRNKTAARPLIVIGVPGDKRTDGIQKAREKLGLPPALIAPYADLLKSPRTLQELAESWLRRQPEPAAAPLLRMESPGGGFELERALIALGAPDAAAYDGDDELHAYGHLPDPQPMSARFALQLRESPGRLYHPSQWYRGYCRMLARLRFEAAEWRPDAEWQNDPVDIAAMTDKRRTQQLLAAAGVAIPKPLSDSARDYDSLREAMKEAGMHRIFIKLATGSAASGVIAYQRHPTTGAEIAMTTIGIERYAARPPAFYNAGKLRRYTDSSDIAAIVDWLYRHGAYAEQWIAKRDFEGRAFDIRQLVVDGEPCHAIARVSSTPITNLHLRSERMPPEQAELSQESIRQVQHVAASAAAAFPRSAVAGIDVLVSEGSDRCYVADVNPFGDLLYGVEHKGMDPYEWEMRTLFGLNGRHDKG
ncbi:STM4014 family protein [Paenibacillus soyae]|uniref:STM4014 family protein n=1 Tax=Paenibacillus soyae TaxID=2969249 RepID=A0A9X2SCN6_9BACL|nr:STM4014 family protein [Paenibacillus soyae]MCR2806963.1 STM4014 family protein [Paenibacillus soyae]